MRVMADMHRRLRRQSAIRMPNAVNQKKPFDPKLMWKKAVMKVRIINVMKNPSLYQGDVMLTKQQALHLVEKTRQHLAKKGIRYPIFSFANSTRIKRKVAGGNFHKWSMPIHYFIEQGVNVNNVEMGLRDLQMRTCLRFKRVGHPIPGSPGLHYFFGQGCVSYIGKIDNTKFQQISLGSDCNSVSIAQHETLHAMGLFHEQSRIDRDKYIYIVTQNIIPKHLHNFDIVDKDDSNSYGLPYDYTSIMHYPINLFGINDQQTTSPKDKTYTFSIGTQEQPTFIDTQTVNIHYCSNICRQKIFCDNWGYQDPNDCSKCICPPGFSGRDCGWIGVSPPECGQTIFEATNKVQGINVNGRKKCYFMITSPEGTKIAYKITEHIISPFYLDSCTYQNSVEIKFWEDKSVSGARYCKTAMNLPLISHYHQLIVIYRSNETTNYAVIAFKAVTKF